MRLIFTAVAALLAPLPAAAQTVSLPSVADHLPVTPAWYRLPAAGDTRTYIDLANIRSEGDVRIATNISLMLGDDADNPIRWVEAVMEYDCAARKGHFLEIKGYDKDRALVGRNGPDDAWRSAAPGTDAANSIDFVCGQNREASVQVADPWADAP